MSQGKTKGGATPIACEDCANCLLFRNDSDPNLDEWGCSRGVFARRRVLRGDGHLHKDLTRPRICAHSVPRATLVEV